MSVIPGLLAGATKYDIIFESKDYVHGVVLQANDWVEYKCILAVKNGGKTPVSLDMEFT
jgi:hypothetical protein